MKKLILLGVLLIISAVSFAQCDKDLMLTSSKTEYLDSLGNFQRSVDEETVIKISKSKIVITPAKSVEMVGNIESSKCDWKVAYKEGKTVSKVLFEGPLGSLHGTVTTEGSNGKLTFLVELVEIPDTKIRVQLDTFQEALK
ncbi:hypothetical protein [Dyadobacter pollutisoli]|uniref:Lipocalin-like domain-containing protein n=1 Tax=Dyadobacter pollutisoli TaxID=2910158 RepID=A0A9E8NEM3_9BACT|nr:hypothetical protein [Dyadobacter pollutisoli]WAC15349.1 hypothetical protein ON006_15550 [Dyadobacter pollutisoli]